MPYSHFVAKISPEGGPNPGQELSYLLEQARGSPKRIAWFASPFTGLDFERAGTSICVIYHHPENLPRVQAVVARILAPATLARPRNEEVQKYYRDWHSRLPYWWKLGGHRDGQPFSDIILVEFPSPADIPGRSWKTGLPAAETFAHMAAVAGWTFEKTFNPLNWLQELRGERPD